MSFSHTHSLRRFTLHSLYALLVLAACGYTMWRPATASANMQAAPAAPAILDRTQTAAIMPATVFYRGQSATIQGRNSAGIHFTNDRYLLAAMVDTGGYSTAIAQTYQAYLITEVPLALGDKTLSPGAYGFGFVENDRMVLMDIGGNRLFDTATTRDPGIKRPIPLQILAAPGNPSEFRLYLGRSFIPIHATTK